MSSRAAILPYPGDPFLFHYWMQFYNNIWGAEVDKLYVHMNSPIEKEVVEYVRKLCAEAKHPVKFIYTPEQIEHGEVINRTLNEVTEDYVMLVEDDGFIFKQRRVDFAFSSLESQQFDIVGSKRGSCSQQILDKAKEKWGLSYEGYGDQGCNFWPCFFFSSRRLLLQTDRNFGARAWKQGDTIEPLNYVVDVPVVAGDTFVNTSLQLRNTIPQDKIAIVPQWHGHPDDEEHYARKEALFDQIKPAFWLHVGSLSSGVGGVLTDDQGRCLSRRLIDEPKANDTLGGVPDNDFVRREWERRVQWWLTFYEERDPAELVEFAELYRVAIDRVVRQFGLDMKAIKRRQAIYLTLGL